MKNLTAKITAIASVFALVALILPVSASAFSLYKAEKTARFKTPVFSVSSEYRVDSSKLAQPILSNDTPWQWRPDVMCPVPGRDLPSGNMICAGQTASCFGFYEVYNQTCVFSCRAGNSEYLVRRVPANYAKANCVPNK